MKFKKAVALAVAAAFVVGGALGCSGKKRPENLPELYNVKVKVTQGGAPLADASLNMIAADGSGGWSVGGKTDANGVASLTTHGDFKGAPAGTYKVGVVKTEFTVKEGAVDDEGNPYTPTPDQLKNPALMDARFVDITSTIPEEYANPQTSPLEATISADTKEISLDVPALE